MRKKGTEGFNRTATDDVYYYHNDHLGTPQQLVDSNGNVVWQAQYSAFGKANITINTVENNLRFAGQYFDVETNLHQNYFRDYDPELGRYLESDPIGLEGGINTYAYVGGNPISFIDPYGLLSAAAQTIVDNAFASHCGNTLGAQDSVMQERIKRGWESLSPEGQALRDAENYLTNYHYVATGSVVSASWFVMGFVATPTWQAGRLAQNMKGKSLHSPASLNALEAGYEGANDALVDHYSPKPSRSDCRCRN